MIEEEGGDGDSDTDVYEHYNTTVLFNDTTQQKPIGFTQAWLLPGLYVGTVSPSLRAVGVMATVAMLTLLPYYRYSRQVDNGLKR